MTVGSPVPRLEDLDLVRGRGRFTDDRTAPGEAVCVFLRSDRPSGRIDRLDVGAAAVRPGVLAVLSAADLQAEGFGHLKPRMMPATADGRAIAVPPHPGLADGAVRFVGEPILAIVADSEAAARDALEAVVLSIGEAPFVLDPLAARSGPPVWPEGPGNSVFVHDLGDAAAVADAFERADHVVRRRLSISRVTAAPMEPRAARVVPGPDGGLTVFTGTQSPHGLAAGLAQLAGMAPDRLRVVSEHCGGSFGMRNGPSPELVVLILAARRLGRPVRWTETRSEAFLADPQAREQVVDAALALDADGRFLALQVESTVALGAHLGPATLHPAVGNLGSLAGVYRTPAIHVRVEGVHVNTQTVAPYRGAGRPEATYVLERMIDLAAATLGMDRVRLRRLNMIRPEEMPYRTPLVFTYDCGDFPGVMEAALLEADWAGFEARRAASRRAGRLRGIGLAMAIEIAGGPAQGPAPEFARLELGPEGAVLTIGSGDSGQGHATAMRQILSRELGLDPEAVSVVAGDTGRVPRGTGSFGSRSAAAAGSVVARVAEAIRLRLLDEAAAHFEASSADIVFEAGAFRVVGTDRAISTTTLVLYRGLELRHDDYTATAGATFPNGCHIAEIEIDPETGAVALLRYLVVDDVGTMINPLLVKGQIHGGVAQGLGQGLMEEIRFDRETGQPLSGSFLDYAMPRAADLPPIAVLTRPVPTAMNRLGVKGAGEAGTVGALPAIASAVADALSPLGIDHLDMPATPARIWSAIRAATS